MLLVGSKSYPIAQLTSITDFWDDNITTNPLRRVFLFQGLEGNQMPNLSPPPLSERIPVNGDNRSGFFAELPYAWCKWFVGLVDNDQNVEARTYTTGTLPAASQHTGKIVFVSDGATGAKFQGSDGTSWLNLG